MRSFIMPALSYYQRMLERGNMNETDMKDTLEGRGGSILLRSVEDRDLTLEH